MPRARKVPAKASPEVQLPPLPPTSSGRQRVLSKKQEQTATEQVEKLTVTQKKAYTQALRAQQASDEHAGFIEQPRVPAPASSRDDIELEEEYCDSPPNTESSFSSTTINPPIKTTVRGGRTLVHRVVPPKDSGSNSTPMSQAPARSLVRRVTGPGRHDSPIMMAASTPVTTHPHFQDQFYNGPGPYSPRVEAHYGRGDGTFHQDRRYRDAEQSDDEFETGSRLGVRFQEPTRYVYPEAHPELESFPRSAAEAERASLKRKSPPQTTSPSSTIYIKKSKTDASGTRGRVRAADFDEMTKSILEDAMSKYRVSIAAEEPYPDRVDDRDLAADAWVRACEDRKLRMDFDEDILKLITARAPQARGQLKTHSRPIVEAQYGLSSENSKRENRDKVEHLLDDLNYLYKDHENRKGLYRNPALQAVINKMWFKNKKDEGVVHPEFSAGGGIAAVTIALTLTAAECVIDEWQTGEQVDVPFSAAVYQEKYLAHLKRLRDFHQSTKSLDIVPRLCKHMFNKARKHAKVEDEATVALSVQLDQADIEAAKAEWETLVLSDCE